LTARTESVTGADKQSFSSDVVRAGDTVKLKFRLRCKYPIRARTFQSRLYEYDDPSIGSVARSGTTGGAPALKPVLLLNRGEGQNMSSVVAISSSSRSDLRTRRAAWYGWTVLAYMLGVIVWGAYVRASGSGAGCGNHWPFCNGEVIPTSPQRAMLIEFTHRITSGLALFSVVAMVFVTWRATVKDAWARKAAAWALVFMINEAALGALLVLLQHVGKDTSVARAVMLGLHLANTFLLIASVALSAYWLTLGCDSRHYARTNVRRITFGLLITLVIGISGALAALGDTLFPATSLGSSMAQDFSSHSYYLVRLRFLHPLLAISGAAYLLWLAARALSTRSERLRAFGVGMMVLIFAQISLGILNVLLLAPVWLQMTHLLTADLLWIVLVLFSDEMLMPNPAREHRLNAVAS
jgi:cytochrome c oxidase assembly protein subunit 15